MIGLLEVAAVAYENGAGIVVDGEVAAVLQGVPVVTGDLTVLVRPGDIDLVVRAATSQHATVAEAEAGQLAVFAGSAYLDVLYEGGALGAAAAALVCRMRHRHGH